MVRVLAQYDPRRVQEIGTAWLLRDVLLAYEAEVARAMREDYERRLMIWAVRSPWVKTKPPEVPPFLKRHPEG